MTINLGEAEEGADKPADTEEEVDAKEEADEPADSEKEADVKEEANVEE